MLRIVRLGSPRHAQEGVRIGTVRRPPRGVSKVEFARRDFYDTWLPELSPSEPLVKLALAARDEAAWRTFVRRFRAELRETDRVHLIATLAALSHKANFSVGCYCEDEARCHRSVLREVFAKAGARVA